MSLFLDHLETLFIAVARGQHFALTRYGDGECAILQDLEISTLCATRHWSYRPSQGLAATQFSKDLNAAFDFDDSAYYVGVSCPCCDVAANEYYLQRLSDQRRRHRTTYANLFSNGNWKYLHARFQGILSEKRCRVVLISNWDKDYRRARNALPYNPVDVEAASAAAYDQPVPNALGEGYYRGGSAQWYCDNKPEILDRFRGVARSVDDAVFLVQLGPVADILIHQMFVANPANTYLDMGHSLDGILYGEPSVYRPYLIGVDAPMCADMPVGWDLQPDTIMRPSYV